MECPLCNGLTSITYLCTECQTNMEDMGKSVDYYDDYSAYLDTDIQKKTDGYSHSLEQNLCPHLLFCATCGKDQVIFINEMSI